MKTTSLALSLIATLSLAACAAPGNGDTDGASSSASSIPDMQTDINISQPLPGTVISSPLVVRGEARGTWFFEASFPVRLLDANGNEITVVPAQAQEEWMTTDFVPYEVTLTFTAPATPTGTLVLEKDNPSGLPENAAEMHVPVRFTP